MPRRSRPLRFAPLFAAFVAASLAPRGAGATVTEPNGLVVPLDSQNGETQLYSFFQGQGEPIDWTADAHTAPDVFSPLCDFSATFLLHEAGSNLGVGWYNAGGGSAPAPSDIHVVVPAGTPVGTVVSSATIKGDPAYAGGLVGFALVGAQTHYSEQAWNPVCSGCSQPGPWATAVVYASKNVPNAYYLAFEDGNVGTSSFGNDGDFNDDVFLFKGITCAGGGVTCDSGHPGACAVGVTVCTTGGVDCQPLAQPADEACNGIDDDCDGTADEDAPCPGDEVCDRGTCVAPCGTGEFQCPADKTCALGHCVDPACQSVTCPAGQVCVDGTCEGPCDGVACPAPTVCRAGRCVDPCAGVVCDSGKVCTNGACVPSCACQPCATGTACDDASGKCLPSGCENQPACPSGEVCVAGACADACLGAHCPKGQLCASGACVDDPDAGAGGAGGSGGSFGGFDGSLGGFGAGGAGGEVDAGQKSHTVTTLGVDDSGACGCRVAGARGRRSALAALVALAALAVGRRARRRRGAAEA